MYEFIAVTDFVTMAYDSLSSSPQAIIAYPWTAMAQTVGTKVEE
jgi:hypothetical protein